MTTPLQSYLEDGGAGSSASLKEVDAECARIMAMSGAELDAHIRAQGEDPAEVVQRFDRIVKSAIEICRLRNAMKVAILELQCPAAEYVPAMPAAWTILEEALSSSERSEAAPTQDTEGGK